MSSSPPKGIGVPVARGAGPEQRPSAFTGGVRRRPAWVWGGLAAVLVSAVGFAVVAAELGGRTDVLVLARDVPAGHVLGVRDVRVVKVAAEEGVVSLEDRAQVLGRRAKVPLVAGSFLAAGQVGKQSGFPPVGWSQVSLGIEAGGAPPDLAKGERVAVLSGPGAANAPADAATSAAVVGTVTGVQAPESAGGLRVVTVLVETGAARRAASFEHPRIVVLPAEGREAP